MFCGYSLLKYKRGYLLFFESYVLPEQLFFGLSSLTQFEWLINANVFLFCLAAISLGGRFLHICLFFSFTLMEYNIAPYLETYTTYLIPYVLLIFCFCTPWSLRLKESKESLLDLVFFLLCLAYLSAGLTKLLINPMGWINGEHLSQHFVFKYLYTNQIFLLDISQNKALLSLIGISTLVFEIFFVTCFFKRKWIPVFLLAGIGFHSGVYWFFHINFFHFFIPLYLAPVMIFISGLSKKKIKSS